MLDVDLEGSATRLSPEAPVPVVDAQRCWHRPGGAGLAAMLAARHDRDVVLVTGIADDDRGARIRELLAAGGVRVLSLPMRGSTVTKTRIRAAGQSLLRVDHGDARYQTQPLPDEVPEALMTARSLCVADYGGGLTALATMREALTRAATTAPMVWDPHPRGRPPIPGCVLVTPNEAEAKQLCPDGSLDALRRQWHAEAVCVTMGARGARLFVGDAPRRHVEVPVVDRLAAARVDACGAGDRFAVAAAVALAEGAGPHEAVVMAVTAAARFVAAGGAAGVSTTASLGHDGDALTPSRQAGAETSLDAAEQVRRWRADGRTVVATGGCFDLLHTGHVNLLRHARQLGDALLVLVNSDESVRALKGPNRPIMPAADRARVVAALGCVDAVFVFDDATPERLLDDLRPDVWVKGGDYAIEDLPEAQVVRLHGGDVITVPIVAGYSTSQLIATARSERANHGRTSR
ncbi:D-glycero-beta-D-manno-heptose 1-phosphate adenylyltransferase [Mycobacterium yunnanensis]|uniref:D-glycero-beta-D-manno-heptose 1-phosphate adenylyltransferase n=2 Tax=Mycobacterium yunnanensis TaxID=368477 RepID=A0A9X2YZG4_9MYCO|nr:D-glycero-beta-D-manno-heptose 1-phosphate adenylyltransferase [Mycobacterium yunnanensis]